MPQVAGWQLGMSSLGNQCASMAASKSMHNRTMPFANFISSTMLLGPFVPCDTCAKRYQAFRAAPDKLEMSCTRDHSEWCHPCTLAELICTIHTFPHTISRSDRLRFVHPDRLPHMTTILPVPHVKLVVVFLVPSSVPVNSLGDATVSLREAQDVKRPWSGQAHCY